MIFLYVFYFNALDCSLAEQASYWGFSGISFVHKRVVKIRLLDRRITESPDRRPIKREHHNSYSTLELILEFKIFT